MLMRGLSGQPVRILQDKLGVIPDGVFGVNTEAALRAYQENNGLAVDGIAGPDTFSQMGLYELVLLSVGSKGEAVKKLQSGLGIDADGIFGHGTAAAVRSFQETNGLQVDGIAGPATLAVVPGFEISADQVAAATQPDPPPVDDAALAAAQAEPPPAEEHQGIVAKVEETVAAVGNSIWNTVKKIF